MSSQHGNFGPLMAEIGWRVSGTQANFNEFRVLASLLQRHQPNFARCLAVSWAGTLHIHFRGLLSPNGILRGAKFTLRPILAFCDIGSVAAQHFSSGPSAKLCGVVQGMELRNFRSSSFSTQAATATYIRRRPSRCA